MPAITPLSDPDVIQNVGASILESIVTALTDCNLAVPERRFVAFCEPPQDCCPDLVVWPTAIRPDDLIQGQGLTRGFFLCNNMWTIDYKVRLGLCYVDTDAQNKPLPPATLDGMSAELHQYWWCVYMNWACRAKNGLISELGQCDKFGVSEAECYAEGGCAGFEFTVTFPLID